MAKDIISSNLHRRKIDDKFGLKGIGISLQAFVMTSQKNHEDTASKVVTAIDSAATSSHQLKKMQGKEGVSKIFQPKVSEAFQQTDAGQGAEIPLSSMDSEAGVSTPETEVLPIGEVSKQAPDASFLQNVQSEGVDAESLPPSERPTYASILSRSVAP